MRWEIRGETTVGNSELLHYGVLGMKWGVRKDDGSSGKKLTTGSHKVTDNQKGHTVINTNDANDYNRLKGYFYEYADTIPATYASSSEAKEKFDNLPKISLPYDSESNKLMTNHNAPIQERRYNCFECGIAYEMRKRGYDVQSNTVPGGYGFEILHAFDVKQSFNVNVSDPDGMKLSNKTKAEECFKKIADKCLTEYGDGSRGILCITYANYDGGHTMNWVVENDKFQLVDTQTGRGMAYETFMQCDANVDIYRLDNAEVLPGVTDFVEPYEATEVEEVIIENLEKEVKKRQKKNNKKKNKVGASTVKSLIKDVSSNFGSYVSKGMEAIGKFIKNPLGIETKEAKVSRGNGTFTKV